MFDFNYSIPTDIHIGAGLLQTCNWTISIWRDWRTSSPKCSARPA